MATERDREKDALTKKIEKLYHNYGIDTSNMSEEELGRLKARYSRPDEDINKDLRASEKFKDRFANDIV